MTYKTPQNDQKGAARYDPQLRDLEGKRVTVTHHLSMARLAEGTLIHLSRRLVARPGYYVSTKYGNRHLPPQDICEVNPDGGLISVQQFDGRLQK